MKLPLDEFALSMIEEAMEAALGIDVHGNPYLERGEFTLDSLLEFWSETGDYVFSGYTSDDIPIYVRDKPRFSERDLIQALIDEVRRLRNELAIYRNRV